MDHLLHCFLWSAWQYVFLFLLLHNFWFSNVTVQFCIPNSTVWKFQLFYVLTGSRFKKKIILDFLKGAQWCFIVVLMCISLMTSGVEDCFRSLFPIYIVFVEVYWYLLSIFIGSVIGLFWECILGTDAFWCDTNISPQFVASIFILSHNMSCQSDVFNVRGILCIVFI